MRYEAKVLIDDKSSRDFGKEFKVTEMDAESAEWWAFRALQAIAAQDVDLPQIEKEADGKLKLSQQALGTLAQFGLKCLAKVPPAQSKPLLDELMGCVSVVLPDGSTRAMRKGDVEEVDTFVRLRMETLKLHLSFFTRGDQ